MAEAAAPRDLLQRYATIEQAYRDDRWQEVIRSGQELLGDLSGSAGPGQPGLRERLELLMAHAHFYGLGNRDTAEQLYRGVLQGGGEPALLEIAEQGLQQCKQPSAAAATEASSSDDLPLKSVSDAAAAAISGAGAAAAAAVRAADPLPEPTAVRREGFPLTELPATAPETGGDPAGSTDAPVMPWLQGVAGRSAVDPGFRPPATTAKASVSVSPLAGSPESPLIPEVVDEPEQFEVIQADPLLADEIEVSMQASQPRTVRPPTARTVATIPVSSRPSPTPVAKAAGMSFTHRRRRLQAGPFAAPPQAVVEEEAELMLGLLRLELG